MGIQSKVTLIGADNPGADNLFEGFTKINDNMDELLDNDSAVNSGATQIGYYNTNTTTPETVQDALDNISYDATNGVTDGANVGVGEGEIYKDKTTNDINFRTLKEGTNVTITTVGDIVTINSGLANAANVTFVDSGFPYDIAADDEIILVNSGDTAVTINLGPGVNKRIVNIKNLAWNGTGASHTSNTTEVTIVPDGTEKVEDDRTGMPSAQTAIGPGSAMRLVYYTATTVWSIV